MSFEGHQKIWTDFIWIAHLPWEEIYNARCWEQQQQHVKRPIAYQYISEHVARKKKNNNPVTETETERVTLKVNHKLTIKNWMQSNAHTCVIKYLPQFKLTIIHIFILHSWHYATRCVCAFPCLIYLGLFDLCAVSDFSHGNCTFQTHNENHNTYTHARGEEK